MKNKVKIYHAGSRNYSNWVPNREIVDTIEEADVVWLEGGEDVHPSIYGEKVSEFVATNLHRDMREKAIFEKAVKLGKKIFGTCRGAQLSCALSGGKVIQHQLNPGWMHDIKTYDKRTVAVTSTHHNAMNPYNLPKEDYKLIGWTESMLPFHLNGEGKESYKKNEKEVEICYFRKTKALGCQPHPEMLTGKSQHAPTIDYFRGLFYDFVNDKL